MTFFSLLDNVKCFECGEIVPVPAIEEHMIMSHNYVKCQKCDQLFIPYRLDEHVRRYHKNKEIPVDVKFACAECNEKVSFLELGKHLLINHNYAECSVCHLLSPEKDFEKHMKSHGMVECQICGDYFLSHMLEIHILDAHDKKTCPKCDELFGSESFNEHMKTRHFYIECEICGILRSPIIMDTHLREEHGFKSCPRCGVIMDEKRLKNHIKNIHPSFL